MARNLEVEHEKPVFSFREKLRGVVESLNAARIDYRIVGSTAIDALLNGSIRESTSRTEKTPKDIDILILAPQTQIGENLFGEFGWKTDDNPQGVDIVVENHFEIEEGRIALRFKNCKVQIPQKTLEPYELEADGMKLLTVPPMTLLHFYLLPGSLRHEDWNRALKLARWIRENGDGDYPKHLYESFHSFNRKRQKMYPLHAFMWRMDKRRNVLGRPSAIAMVKKIPGVGKILRGLRRRVIT